MTTEQLIKLLVADLEPVDCGRIARALVMAMVAGAAATFGVMFLLLGPHPKTFDHENSSFLVMKLMFTSGVVAMAAVFLPQIARPGAVGRNFLVFVSLPFLAIAALASEALASAHWSMWGNMIVGSTWLACLFTIPFLALAPFLALVWALRVGAPTALIRAGAAAGLVAGGLSAMACSLPCLDHSFPSIAVWYGLPIVICAIVGAKLGPSLLRW
jgi:hypothetical protein